MGKVNSTPDASNRQDLLSSKLDEIVCGNESLLYQQLITQTSKYANHSQGKGSALRKGVHQDFIFLKPAAIR